MEDDGEVDELGETKIILSLTPIASSKDLSDANDIKSLHLCKRYIANVVFTFPGELKNGNLTRWRNSVSCAHAKGKIHGLTSESIPKANRDGMPADKYYIKAQEYSSVAEMQKLKECGLIPRPQFLDETTFVMYESVCLSSMFHRRAPEKATLNVDIIARVPVIPKSPKTTTEDFLLQQSLSNSPDTVTELKMKLSKEILISKPPEIQLLYKDVAGRHLIFMQIFNAVGCDITIRECNILPGHCHVSDRLNTEEEKNVKMNRHACQSNRLPLVAVCTDSVIYPLHLRQRETVSLIYELLTDQMDAKLRELSFHLHLKWGYLDSQSAIETSYNLPMLRIRHVPFVMTAMCDSSQVNIGQSFTVSYSLRNNLQDFLAWRLYWDLRDSNVQLKDIKKKKESPKHSIVCHDPIIEFGLFKRNTVQNVKIEFTVLQEGLYEFGKEMKMNLTYMVPNEEFHVEKSTKNLPQSKNYLDPKSQDVWRGRLGSTSSLGDKDHTPPEERRFSFATKSYSFGDFGPSGSQDSTEGEQTSSCFKSESKGNTLSPGNSTDKASRDVDGAFTLTSNSFKKNSMQIYLPSPIC